MEDFEKQMAEKIKQQLDSGELDNIDESQPATESAVTTDTQQEIIPEVKQEPAKEEKETKKKGGILTKIFGMPERDTKHFDRKEKVRPLAVIVAILSSILCIGVLALAVFCIIKIVPFAWESILKIIYVFFSEKALALSLGLAIIPGGLLVFFLAGIFFGVILAAGTFGFIFFNFPITAIQTAKLPKQVFAYERDSAINMILGYVFGALVTFLGFAMYMDGSLGHWSYFVLAAGIILFIVAILLTIDLAQCKKVFKNLDNEQEKNEIIEEAKVIKRQKELKRKNKNIAVKVLERLFKKKK